MASEIDMSFLLVIDVQMALGIWFTSNGANCKPVIFSWRTMSRKGDLAGIVDSERCASRAQITNPNRVLQVGETRGSGFCSQLRNKNFKLRVRGRRVRACGMTISPDGADSRMAKAGRAGESN
jgi:hypothetical protein